MVKNPFADTGDLKRHRFNPWVRKIPWREGMATHSSLLAWRIPRTEEPGGAIVHSVAQSQTQLKRLSSSPVHLIHCHI